jgi:hypothetical protein
LLNFSVTGCNFVKTFTDRSTHTLNLLHKNVAWMCWMGNGKPGIFWDTKCDFLMVILLPNKMEVYFGSAPYSFAKACGSLPRRFSKI